MDESTNQAKPAIITKRRRALSPQHLPSSSGSLVASEENDGDNSDEMGSKGDNRKSSAPVEDNSQNMDLNKNADFENENDVEMQDVDQDKAVADKITYLYF